MAEQKNTGKSNKNKRVRNIIYYAVICVLSAVMLFSLYKVITISAEYRAGEEEYENIADSFVEDYQTYAIPNKKKPVDTSADASAGNKEEGNTDSQQSGADSGTGEAADTLPPDVPAPETEADDGSDDDEIVIVPSVNISYLKYKNPDFTGWLYLDGTVLNYPVVQGEDNDYYLDHTFYGQENANGCLFIDYRLDLSADNYNTIFYGHNMKTGVMFALLKKYAQQSYYNSHKYMIYVTEDGPYLISVFSAYTVSAKSDSWRIDFTGEADYERWLDSVCDASEINTGITPTTDDRVVTLTTCTFVYDNARFVVHGIIEPLF